MIKLTVFFLCFYVLASLGALMTGDDVMSCFSGFYAMVFALALIFAPREACQ